MEGGLTSTEAPSMECPKSFSSHSAGVGYSLMYVSSIAAFDGLSASFAGVEEIKRACVWGTTRGTGARRAEEES